MQTSMDFDHREDEAQLTGSSRSSSERSTGRHCGDTHCSKRLLTWWAA